MTGTVGLSGIRSDSIGSEIDDERMHELMWNDFDQQRTNTAPVQRPLRVSDEDIQKAVAKNMLPKCSRH